MGCVYGCLYMSEEREGYPRTRVRAREATDELNDLALSAPRVKSRQVKRWRVVGMPRIGGVLVRHRQSGEVVLVDPRSEQRRTPGYCVAPDEHRVNAWYTRNGWTECSTCVGHP
jgi:hypothetical protein